MFPIFHGALEQVFNTIIKTVANLIKILPCIAKWMVCHKRMGMISEIFSEVMCHFVLQGN